MLGVEVRGAFAPYDDVGARLVDSEIAPRASGTRPVGALVRSVRFGFRATGQAIVLLARVLGRAGGRFGPLGGCVVRLVRDRLQRVC